MERRFGNRDRGSSFGGGGFKGGGSSFGRRSFGPREMHKAKCSDCGKDCEVPFVPGKDAQGNLRPVYCLDCFKKRKGIQTNTQPAEQKEASEETEEIEDEEETEEEM